jgi:hypothetical protein
MRLVGKVSGLPNPNSDSNAHRAKFDAHLCVCVFLAGVEKGRRWAVDNAKPEGETNGGEGAIVRTQWGWRQYSQLFCTRDDAQLWCVGVWPLPTRHDAHSTTLSWLQV